jgi:peroxiredoxin
MKPKLMVLIVAASLLLFSLPAAAAETNDVSAELKALVTKIETKLKAGQKDETNLTDEIKEFDTILAKHKDEKTDDVAQVLMMKAMLYFQVLDNTEKGIDVVKQVKRDFPETQPGKNADEIIENVKKQEEGKKIQRQLVKGSKFPDFDEKDIDGKHVSVSDYKGKVVLVDFWATWCGPCVHELPNVIKAYEKHHEKGFDIIGVSLDQSQDKLKGFLKDRKVTWQQFFDGKGWGNKLATKYGVQSIPATYLLDRDGKIIDKDLRGEALEGAVATALAKN